MNKFKLYLVICLYFLSCSVTKNNSRVAAQTTIKIIKRKEDKSTPFISYNYQLITIHNDTVSTRGITSPSRSKVYNGSSFFNAPYSIILDSAIYFSRNMIKQFDQKSGGFDDTIRSEDGIYDKAAKYHYIEALGINASAYNLRTDVKLDHLDSSAAHFYRHPLIGFLERNSHSNDTFWFISGEKKDLKYYEKKLAWPTD